MLTCLAMAQANSAASVGAPVQNPSHHAPPSRQVAHGKQPGLRAWVAWEDMALKARLLQIFVREHYSGEALVNLRRLAGLWLAWGLSWGLACLTGAATRHLLLPAQGSLGKLPRNRARRHRAEASRRLWLGRADLVTALLDPRRYLQTCLLCHFLIRLVGPLADWTIVLPLQISLVMLGLRAHVPPGYISWGTLLLQLLTIRCCWKLRPRTALIAISCLLVHKELAMLLRMMF